MRTFGRVALLLAAAGSLALGCGDKGGTPASTCVAGTACTPANPCRLGAISCATGAPVCQEVADAPDGLGCGAGFVCSSGTCRSCVTGATCTPSNACRTGATSCTTGAPVCTETGNAPNGTSCGANLYCTSGTCGACVAGATCTPSNPCRTGAISCTGGTPTCGETGNAPNGTSCGMGYACSSGTCVASATPSGGALQLSAAAGRMTGGTVTLDAQVGLPVSPGSASGGTITLQGATFTR